MARRAPAPTYRAAMTAIRDAYLALLLIMEEHSMAPELRTQLGIVILDLERLVQRDNGRSR